TLLDQPLLPAPASPYAVTGRELVRTTLPALLWLHRQPEAFLPATFCCRKFVSLVFEKLLDCVIGLAPAIGNRSLESFQERERSHELETWSRSRFCFSNDQT